MRISLLTREIMRRYYRRRGGGVKGGRYLRCRASAAWKLVTASGLVNYAASCLMNELTNIESTIVSSYSPLPCSAAAAAAAGRGGEGTNRARACRQFLASLASKRRSPSDRSLGEGAAPRFNLYTQRKRSVIRFSDSDSTLSHAENFFRFVSPLSLLIIPRSWFSVPRSCLSLSLSLSPPPPRGDDGMSQAGANNLPAP